MTDQVAATRATAVAFAVPAFAARPAAETRWQAFAVDLLVGGLAAGATAMARIGIEQVVGGVAPFVLTFPVVMAATLLRGGRAGTIAAVCCQLLTIRFVFPNWVATHGGTPTEIANMILSTLALAATVWATAAYRRNAALLRTRCQRQIDTLSLLIAEMDHRTKNNFQLAAGLLAHQAVTSLDGQLARELERAASRLETIASVYQDLTPRIVGDGPVDLAEHIGRIVAQLRAGTVPEHVLITLSTAPACVPAQTATIVGLVVNEWVANAVKYAFGDGPGRIDVTLRHGGGRIDVIVADDGTAHNGAAAGRGSQLMHALAQIVGAELMIEHRRGTRCSLGLCNDGARQPPAR